MPTSCSASTSTRSTTLRATTSSATRRAPRTAWPRWRRCSTRRRATTVAEINSAFAERAAGGPLAGILAYSDEPIVSTDIVKSPFSALFDAPLTAVMDGTQVKVVGWYDNEWGYASRLVELAERVLAPVPVAA